MIETVNPHAMAPDEPLTGTDQLALFLGGSGDSWTGDFLRLVAKSDPEHRRQLHRAFPVHVDAWLAWQAVRAPTVGELTRALRIAGHVDD